MVKGLLRNSELSALSSLKQKFNTSANTLLLQIANRVFTFTLL